MKTIILFIALSLNIFAQSNLIILMSSDPTVAGIDTIPSQFTFTDVTDAALSSYNQAYIVVAGCDSARFYTNGTDSLKLGALGTYDVSEIWADAGDSVYMGNVASATNSTATHKVLYSSNGTPLDTFSVTTVAGGDSLGVDLLVNGTMETAFSGEWIPAFADVTEQSSTRAHAGTYSCKVTTSAGGGGQQTITVETGVTYWIEGYVWIVTGSCKINVDAGQLGDQIETLGEWVYFKRQFTAGDTETFIRVNANENVTEYYFDDITVKELL